MRPIVVTVGPLTAASANNIALSQTPSRGALTLNGSTASAGVATLDHARQVLITTAADESGHTFLVTGTDWAGGTISETITGANAGTTASVLNYLTVTSIVISANATGAITVGTNGIAASAWVRLDSWADGSANKTCVVTGTVNYTVQYSNDDPNSPTNSVAPALMTWFSDMDLAFQAATTSQAGLWAFAPLWIRVLLNSGTGTVTMTVVQTGVVSR